MLVNLSVKAAVCAIADPILTVDSGLSVTAYVKESGIPIPCRVRLFEKKSGKMIYDKATNKDGYIRFNHLARVECFAIAFHPDSSYNALIFDNIISK